jgi:hypothetical protein
LSRVRHGFALERTDNITASAVSARDEIGRAVAAKIREMDSARDLKKVCRRRFAANRKVFGIARTKTAQADSRGRYCVRRRTWHDVNVSSD